MSDTASIKDEMSTVTPATSLAETSDSISESPNPSNADGSASRFKHDDALTADQLDSLYDDLPEDSTALKAIVGTMRLEMSKRDNTIAKLREEIDEVRASHSVVLQRSADWKDELEMLRSKVPQLEVDLKEEKEARELEADRVKDLRLRAEESRRAIMRLQGDQGAARAKAKADNRRSMGPGVLASWAPPGSAGGRDEQAEDAELKKSKRASMVFGPNGTLNIAAANGRSGGHRRTASGSRSVSGNSRAGDGGDDLDEPLSPTLTQNAGGLRGLRLSGSTFAPNSLHPSAAANGDDSNSNAGSRRSSYNNGSRSPRLSVSELPGDAEASASSRLAVPSAAGGIRGMLGLASPTLSQSGSGSSGFAPPIPEDGEERADNVASSDGNPTSGVVFTEADLKAKNLELERLSHELRETKNRMEEAVEARLASEACLKALREFISTHDAAADAGADDEAGTAAHEGRSSVGAGLLKGVKLPPLPTDDIDDDAAEAASSKRDSKAAGWSMKLPQLMRKNTLSSTGSGPSPGQTPSEEGGAGAQTTTGTSPKRNASGGSAVSGLPTSSSIGGSLASLLSRNGAGLSSFSSAAAATTPDAASGGAAASDRGERPGTASELVASPSAASATFKGFGWFKKGSQATTPGSQQEGLGSPLTEFEDKVMSPPFRSLEHDQVAIRRQSVLGADVGGARPGGDESADSGPKRPAEPELSLRAQKALEKTANVEHGGDFVPAAFD